MGWIYTLLRNNSRRHKSARYFSSVVLIFTKAFLLTACASQPVSLSEAKAVSLGELYAYQVKLNSDDGKIIIIREPGLMGSGCDAVIYIEGKKSAKIGAGQRASFYVPYGLSRVGVGLAGKGLCLGMATRTISVEISKGDEKSFVIGTDHSGFHIGPYVSYK